MDTFSISEYEELISPTDRLPKDNLVPLLQGLFSEVGSVMATSKKLHREQEAYLAYQSAVVEELGDVLWYLTAILRRLNIALSKVLENALPSLANSEELYATSLSHAPLANVKAYEQIDKIDDLLLQLGREAADLLQIHNGSQDAMTLLVNFTSIYLQVVQSVKVPFSVIVQTNLQKARGRFIPPDIFSLPNFDAGFDPEERLPDAFRIEIKQRASGRSYLRWNGVFIGDPLTDNIADKDAYRFHDVFHFAYAAILHWSPTFRALIKHKRKSCPETEEAQDSGRAIVVEEGLSAYIFSSAKHLNFFENQTTVSFDILKTIQDFVRGYEVEQCPLSLWERAVLDGFRVFREVRDHNGGIVIGNRKERTLQFEELK